MCRSLQSAWKLGAASVAEDFLKRAEDELEEMSYQELQNRLEGKIDRFSSEMT